MKFDAGFYISLAFAYIVGLTLLGLAVNAALNGSWTEFVALVGAPCVVAWLWYWQRRETWVPPGLGIYHED